MTFEEMRSRERGGGKVAGKKKFDQGGVAAFEARNCGGIDILMSKDQGGMATAERPAAVGTIVNTSRTQHEINQMLGQGESIVADAKPDRRSFIRNRVFGALFIPAIISAIIGIGGIVASIAVAANGLLDWVDLSFIVPAAAVVMLPADFWLKRILAARANFSSLRYVITNIRIILRERAGEELKSLAFDKITRIVLKRVRDSFNIEIHTNDFRTLVIEALLNGRTIHNQLERALQTWRQLNPNRVN